ncbi:hypothetical protein AB0A74_26465 [Saccharothrix sp. NPDC042600]|uniref:hypothetical protein n=1 Tax=Saccharothrix TaxID=2071 RepID=UPI0033DA4FA0|nr:hypothetical protein GCM10017745_46290 [Saccharothrix mutabilis subsp. capreolus]
MTEPATNSADTRGLHAQISALTEIVGALARNLRRVEGNLKQDTKAAEYDPAEPAPWVWFSPPAAAEDDPDGGEDPRATVENFVAWYNLTFVGITGGRSKPVPACWQRHPALSMEIATLAYTWRAANIGSRANERDAQFWLHQWRPGFSDRLARDWVHPDCLDGLHRDEGPPPRTSRFEPEDERTMQRADPHTEG